MEAKHRELVEQAKHVLAKNWMGGYTRPSSLLYPHQWSWDSGFIAIGNSTYDQDRAQIELSSLFRAQWKNGMVPQIVFTPNVSEEYFPDAEFWNSAMSKNAPNGIKTSGITQPPVHASAALCIYKRANDNESALDFLEKLYPRLLASHRFFYNERDPNDEGLVYIRHPWESGIDNSPTWDIPLNKIDLEDTPALARRDLQKGVPKEQRPKDWDYNRYIYLVELFKDHKYDEAEILNTSPFLLQDALVNSILVKANQDLVRISEIIGENPSEIIEWEKKTNEAINKKLWHRGHGFYDAYDLRGNLLIEVDTAAGFCPLYAGVPDKNKAEKLLNYLDSKSFCQMHGQKCFSIPNYNMEGEYFDPENYWRGPVWINMNWMLYQGLRRYEFQEKAESVKNDILELVQRFGFHEYYDPIKGRGYGSDNFSWTAALFLDTFYEENQWGNDL
jgi:hypothetical protein